MKQQENKAGICLMFCGRLRNDELSENARVRKTSR